MASEISSQEAAIPANASAVEPNHTAAGSAASVIPIPQRLNHAFHPRRPGESAILWILGLALTSIVALGLLQVRLIHETANDNAWVSHTQEVLREVGKTQQSLNDSEACTQAFLLTGETEPLKACRQAIQSIGDHVQNLRGLTADNPVQQARLINLAASVRNATSGLTAEIDISQSSATASAAAQSRVDNALRRTLGQARAIVGGMEITEIDLLNQRKSAAEHSRSTTTILIFVGSAAAFLLLAGSGSGLYLGMLQRRRTEAALREEEQRFALMVEGVQDYAICMLDAGGKVISWNQGAERIMGYKASEIIGQNFARFFPETEAAAGIPQQELEVAAKEGRMEGEGWRLRKNGSKIWASVVMTARRNEVGELVGFSKVTRDVTERMKTHEALRKEVTERREAQAKLHASERSLRNLSLHLLHTQDEERRRIGRDMHDTLGQYLSVIKMRLDSMIAQQPGGGPAVKELTRCADLADQCIKEVRTFSYLLYPPMLEEMGLGSAIPWYLEGFSKRSEIKTNLEIPEDLERLPADVELTLFRVLQESLTNVHRHSGSKTADVLVSRGEKEVVLEVRDHGKGLGPGSLEEPGQDWTGAHGVGLRGMNERLQQLGGSLDVSFSEQGTIVRAIIPLRVGP